MIEFRLEGDFITMIQLLKATSLVESGADAQAAVGSGAVTHNGKVDYRKRLKVRRGDTVSFAGRKIKVI